MAACLVIKIILDGGKDLYLFVLDTDSLPFGVFSESPLE